MSQAERAPLADPIISAEAITFDATAFLVSGAAAGLAPLFMKAVEILTGERIADRTKGFVELGFIAVAGYFGSKLFGDWRHEVV
jgi:hypothetical protein